MKEKGTGFALGSWNYKMIAIGFGIIILGFILMAGGKSDDPEEAHVRIENGELKSGVIDAEGMGGILLNELFLHHGPDLTREFIDKSTKLSIRSIMNYGFILTIK